MVCIFVLLLVLLIIDNKDEIGQNKKYILKSQGENVVLFLDGKSVAIYDGINSENLPIKDKLALKEGIEFDNIDDAISTIEDYDG